MTVDVDASATELSGSRLTICRNAQCVSGGLRPPLKKHPEAVYLPPSLKPPPQPVPRFFDVREHWGLLYTDPPGAPWHQVVWNLPEELRGGDRYHVVLKDAAGRTLLEHHERVTSYELTYPTGEDCPPGCLGAAVDRRVGGKGVLRGTFADP